MSRLPPLGALLLPLAALLIPTYAQDAYSSSRSESPKDNNANCSCYVVSSGAESSTPEYFQYYRFYDFRDLAGGLEDAPPLINNSQNASLVPTWQPKLFNSEDFIYDWGVQNWSKDATADFPTPMSNSAANIYLGEEDNSTFLSLRTARTEDRQNAGEMENEQKNLMHVSMRMYARVIGAKGAVAGFFTFFDDKNESDIEILTNDPTDQIRYTNQPSVNKEGDEIEAASQGPTDLAAWDEWQMHRVDWLPGNSFWYLNDKQVAANTYSVPRKPSGMVLNMWSDGGSWSGNMSVGDFAEFHVQWIEMTFNTSGPYLGPNGGDKKKRSVELESRKVSGCQNVCKIDGVKERGVPEIAHFWDGGEDTGSGLSAGAKAGIAIGIILLVALLAAAAWFFWRKKKGPAAHRHPKGEYELRSDGYGEMQR